MLCADLRHNARLNQQWLIAVGGSAVRTMARSLEQDGCTPFDCDLSICMCCESLQRTKDGEVKMVTVMLIGQPDCCEKARALIEEAMDNREQKQQQRQKEYAKKRDAKVCWTIRFRALFEPFLAHVHVSWPCKARLYPTHNACPTTVASERHGFEIS